MTSPVWNRGEGQIDDMGQYEGGRCHRKSDIVIFFSKMQFSSILMFETDFMNTPEFASLEHSKLLSKNFSEILVVNNARMTALLILGGNNKYQGLNSYSGEPIS